MCGGRTAIESDSDDDTDNF